MKSFTEIIDKFGGQVELASILGTSQQNISQMKARDLIPPRHWMTIVNEAKKRGFDGITVDGMAAYAAKRPVRSESAA